MKAKLDRAVFLDRDGTLIRNQHYGCDPRAIEWMEGVVEGLRTLRREGYQLIVITNQSGVARGLFSEEALLAMHRGLEERLALEGIAIDAFYYCPHHPLGRVAEYTRQCDCRKPRPGMLSKACAELGIDPSRSWMIGDILDDVEAGHAAGCRAILVDVGTEADPERPERTPDYVARDFLDAVDYVLANSERAVSPLQTAPKGGGADG